MGKVESQKMSIRELLIQECPAPFDIPGATVRPNLYLFFCTLLLIANHPMSHP
ncbi:MAG: hypothetical protein ACLRK0_15085 [[Clostridium] scindens]